MVGLVPRSVESCPTVGFSYEGPPRRGAALNQVDGRNTVHDDKIIADCGFHFADNFQWHAHAIFVATAPLIAAVVGALN